MKQIRNKSGRRVKITLADGEVRRLDPGTVTQVSDEDIAHQSVRKLMLAGKIEILATTAKVEGIRETGSAPGQPQGQSQTPFRGRRGDR